MTKKTKKKPAAPAGQKEYQHPAAIREYLNRIGAEVLNFRRAMVRDYRGAYYVERSLITFMADGSVMCSRAEYAPTDDERAAIKDALRNETFPRHVEASEAGAIAYMEKEKLDKRSTFSFYNRANGQITMLQERIQVKGGGKAYIPHTLWSDGVWRKMEPEGKLPFWKPKDKLKTRVMMHEGAKTAAYMHALTTDGSRKDELLTHPWGEFLAEFEHWGMIGGALATHRADYEELHREKPTEVVYVCDNDFAGHAALQDVSRSYGDAMKGVRFDNRWPQAWDLADPMPDTLFSGPRYIGPRLQDLMVPATRATEKKPNPDGKGRPIIALRRTFCEEWFHCVTPEVFVHRDFPDKIFIAKEFNNLIAPFSDTKDTATLVMQDAASKGIALRYTPGVDPGIYGSAEDGRFVNTFVPAPIDEERGDPSPFVEFMEHLIPDEQDRHEMYRWIATLIARPEIKMLYGVLLISEIQGIGKGTLAERILDPLVGHNNCSYPSEQEIVDSNYNYWLAHKRLAVVHEIYAGHSSKAYNRLKSIITDKYITVSKKFQANYQIENWVHVFACSNSKRALQLTMDDRRWFVPRVTEQLKPTDYWMKLNRWLSDGGGLGIIKWWARAFVEKHGPVQKGSPSPWSSVKQSIVEEGYSPGMSIAARVLDDIKAILDGTDPDDEAKRKEWIEKGYMRDGSVFVSDNQIVELIKRELYNGQHNDRLERPSTIRKLAKTRGWFPGERKVKHGDWNGARDGFIISNTKEMSAIDPQQLAGKHVPADKKMNPIDLGDIWKM